MNALAWAVLVAVALVAFGRAAWVALRAPVPTRCWCGCLDATAAMLRTTMQLDLTDLDVEALDREARP